MQAAERGDQGVPLGRADGGQCRREGPLGACFAAPGSRGPDLLGEIKVRRDRDGRLVTIAGRPYAAVWTLALALRLGFAYGSTHWFTRQIASFSTAHHVPSATYGTAFVIMVLTMIVARTIGVVLRGRAAGATISFSDLRIARRLAR